MSFIPFMSQSPPSPRAYELGRRLKETIDGFRQENPGVSGADVRQAMSIATQSEAGRQPIAIALAIGLVLFGVLAFLFYSRQSGDVDRSLMMVIFIGAGIVLVGLKAFLRNR